MFDGVVKNAKRRPFMQCNGKSEERPQGHDGEGRKKENFDHQPRADVV